MAKKERDRNLSVTEMRSGYLAALAQADSLVSEASLLIQNREFAGAYQRLVHALEELGKTRMLMYQGVLFIGGERISWTLFWKGYYSHVAKLRETLVWHDASYLASHATNTQQIEDAFESAIERAKEIDATKQATTYSDFGATGFRNPKNEDFAEDVEILIQVANDLLTRAKQHELTLCSDDEAFQVKLLAMYRYTSALGFAPINGKDVCYEHYVDGNQPFWAKNSCLPTDQAFMTRVAERYQVIPAKISVTLNQLSQSQEFESFYESLKNSFGYPDWLILGTIYNIALNSRINAEVYVQEGRVGELMSWAEDPLHDQPLDISIFIDPELFDRMLGIWLTSFLAGLGVMPQDTGAFGARARRFAARHYGLYNRDIEHQAIFTRKNT